MLNTYRIAGDAVHLLAFLVLLGKLWMCKSAAGVSLKAQFLYTLALTARYSDLFTNAASPQLYILLYKMSYLCLSYAILISIYWKFYKTYDKESDSFQCGFLIFAVALLSLIYNYSMEPLEILWTFSEYLECVAAWPQFYMIIKTKKVRIGVFLYLLAIGVYRILYIQNWIYKYYTLGYYDTISDVSGSIQVVPYFAFWILCLLRVVEITGEKQSWFAHNLAEKDQNGIFTIKVNSDTSKDGTVPLLTSPVDVVRDADVPESNDVAKI